MTSPQQHPATTRRGQGVTADGEFYMPTRVLFGRGVAGQAGARAAGLGMHKVLLVTDPGVQAAGLTGPVRDNLIAAVDSLHCRLATPASDALALEGARLVARYIRRAATSPADIEARCGMAQGSLTAGIAVGLTDVAGAHCLAEAIGGLYGHPHGYCCAASMPPIMEYNLPVSADKYARLAHAFGITAGGAGDEELARLAIEFIRQLNRDLAVPPMRQLIRAEDLQLLGQKAEQNTSTPSNPRAADAAAFTAMFAREIAA